MLCLQKWKLIPNIAVVSVLGDCVAFGMVHPESSVFWGGGRRGEEKPTPETSCLPLGRLGSRTPDGWCDISPQDSNDQTRGSSLSSSGRGTQGAREADPGLYIPRQDWRKNQRRKTGEPRPQGKQRFPDL